MSRKNHKMIDGKLLQTDKKYSNLKMKQKEKINQWINEEIIIYYKQHGSMPTKEHFETVIDRVYERIGEADIWITYSEIHKRFYGKGNSLCNKVYGQIQREQHCGGICMRKCTRCNCDMIENYDVKVEGGAYGLKITKQGLFKDNLGKVHVAVCPECGYLEFYLEDTTKIK